MALALALALALAPAFKKPSFPRRRESLLLLLLLLRWLLRWLWQRQSTKPRAIPACAGMTVQLLGDCAETDT